MWGSLRGDIFCGVWRCFLKILLLTSQQAINGASISAINVRTVKVRFQFHLCNRNFLGLHNKISSFLWPSTEGLSSTDILTFYNLLSLLSEDSLTVYLNLHISLLSRKRGYISFILDSRYKLPISVYQCNPKTNESSL